MWKLLEWFLTKKTDAVKLGGAVGGGAGLLMLVMFLHGDGKLEIKNAEARSKEYVDLKYENISSALSYLKEGQKEIKDRLIIMDERRYKEK